MSPVQHQVTGAALAFSIEDEMRTVRDELSKGGDRIGRTLVKDGALRVTLIGVRPGGGRPVHTSRGPITIHVLEGAIEVEARGTRWPLGEGKLLALDGGVPHNVTSAGGGIFLLTVLHEPSAGTP
jgi:quercetin dioxygenase-like cupin family protein